MTDYDKLAYFVLSASVISVFVLLTLFNTILYISHEILRLNGFYTNVKEELPQRLHPL